VEDQYPRFSWPARRLIWIDQLLGP